MATKIKAVKGIKVKLPKAGKLPKVPKEKGSYSVKHASAIHLKIPKA